MCKKNLERAEYRGTGYLTRSIHTCFQHLRASPCLPSDWQCSHLCLASPKISPFPSNLQATATEMSLSGAEVSLLNIFKYKDMLEKKKYFGSNVKYGFPEILRLTRSHWHGHFYEGLHHSLLLEQGMINLRSWMSGVWTKAIMKKTFSKPVLRETIYLLHCKSRAISLSSNWS